MLDEVGREFPPDLWLLHFVSAYYIIIYKVLEIEVVEANDPWNNGYFQINI